MSDISSHWRPRPQIRTKALALLWRDDALLVCAIRRDDGTIKGWRPLGGTVEFGERAADTIVRELSEEIGATAQITGLRGVLENIYTHHGHTGHEVVFLFDATLTAPGLARADDFILTEDDGSRHLAAWVPRDRFAAQTARLFPDGLLALL
ncbi:NUDIX hydrolase [Pseudooctadecabacter sp.]|uniref:NUDIX hydrolase n=1 Tax=Pseudooctadecabacter sp. TaxID=1966338 RepID=UPI0025FC398D|nr:NUDIX domain-containing protein [Pseudooctadecabacter sp.]